MQILNKAWWNREEIREVASSTSANGIPMIRCWDRMHWVGCPQARRTGRDKNNVLAKFLRPRDNCDRDINWRDVHTWSRWYMRPKSFWHPLWSTPRHCMCLNQTLNILNTRSTRRKRRTVKLIGIWSSECTRECDDTSHESTRDCIIYFRSWSWWQSPTWLSTISEMKVIRDVTTMIKSKLREHNMMWVLRCRGKWVRWSRGERTRK